MKTDCAVIGAGSGGIGAAHAAARLGLKTVLIEKADRIGGTAVRADVAVEYGDPGAHGFF